MFALYHQLATERFERRLGEEISGVRLELHKGLGGIREDMANMRADLFKWALLFWIGQFAALIGALSFMLPPR